MLFVPRDVWDARAAQSALAEPVSPGEDLQMSKVGLQSRVFDAQWAVPARRGRFMWGKDVQTSSQYDGDLHEGIQPADWAEFGSLLVILKKFGNPLTIRCTIYCTHLGREQKHSMYIIYQTIGFLSPPTESWYREMLGSGASNLGERTVFLHDQHLPFSASGYAIPLV